MEASGGDKGGNREVRKFQREENPASFRPRGREESHNLVVKRKSGAGGLKRIRGGGG